MQWMVQSPAPFDEMLTADGAVRSAYARAWVDFPDAQWTRARHFVSGRRGVSEWTFVGTRASDGRRIEVDGCDLFTFHGGKIRVKDSWRKSRP